MNLSEFMLLKQTRGNKNFSHVIRKPIKTDIFVSTRTGCKSLARGLRDLTSIDIRFFENWKISACL